MLFWAREKVNVNLPSTGRERRGGSSLEIQTDAFHLPSQPPPSLDSYRSLCWLENGRGYGATRPFITLYSSNKVEGVRWKDNIREIRIQHSKQLCINILFSCNYSQCLFCFPAVSNIFLCVLNIFHVCVIIVNSWQPLLACVTSSNIIGQSRNMS